MIRSNATRGQQKQGAPVLPGGCHFRGRAGKPRGQGFTLVEVLITVALLAVTLMLLLIPITNSLNYFRTGAARADAQNVARIALEAMARELQEAMYVQLDMYDNTMLAFIPPLRVDPRDPNSEIVTPPRPDWDHAIRYWRALHDPTADYNPGIRVAADNTYFLARTVVEYPFTTDDPWNRWNDTWAWQANNQGMEDVSNWAPIPRVVHSDTDAIVGGTRGTTQPGYPYLDVRYQVINGWLDPAQAARPYRDLVIGMTPNATDYDVTTLEFRPLVVSGEWLTPISRDGSDDHSVYRTRYPLWRLGVPTIGWTSLPGIAIPPWMRNWARDPFVVIYRMTSGELGSPAYQLLALGCFDPRSRTMRVFNVDPQTGQIGGQFWDNGTYPVRPDPLSADSPWTAFGIDWIAGSLRFDFSPPHDNTPQGVEGMRNGEPLHVLEGQFNAQPLAEGAPVYEKALLPVWEARAGGDQLFHFLLPDSVQVRIDTNADELPDRALNRVYCTPRSGRDEFQVGDDPTWPGGESPLPRYGWVRLPERLADGGPANTRDYWISFRWRSNGVWAKTLEAPLGREYPDLVCAYYRSAAVLDVSLTVTRVDPRARPGQRFRVAQSAHLTRRVKLRNALREISYEAR